MADHAARVAGSVVLTEDQLRRRERWQARWNLPIVLAAFVPLFVNSPDSRVVELCVGIGSWLVFVVDLVMQRRIDPRYVHRRQGRLDLVVVLLTFPFYTRRRAGSPAWRSCSPASPCSVCSPARSPISSS
jgi:hypothetical protein